MKGSNVHNNGNYFHISAKMTNIFPVNAKNMPICWGTCGGRLFFRAIDGESKSK